MRNLILQTVAQDGGYSRLRNKFFFGEKGDEIGKRETGKPDAICNSDCVGDESGGVPSPISVRETDLVKKLDWCLLLCPNFCVVYTRSRDTEKLARFEPDRQREKLVNLPRLEDNDMNNWPYITA